MSFVDKVRIHVKAGRGGNGCLSFLREKFRPYGGPNGADGGKGGDIWLVADANLATLLDFARRPHLEAQDGFPGKGGNKTGGDGADLEIRVPVGTVVYKDGALAADLSSSGERWLAARGGRGGRGNLSFKSQKNTAPRIYEKGEPGQTADLDLELKLIADVGLVGFPNAGKSTLLSRLSNARPKIAAYPFTTLSPHLGIVEHKQTSFVMADIPGLIEGAHAGKGLGDEFLRHVERTRVLVHMIDPAGFSGVDAVSGVRKIEEELKLYSRTLAAKPRLLAVNKMDLPEGAAVLKKVKARWSRRAVFGVSAATGEGLKTLLDKVIGELAKAGREPVVFVPAPAGDVVKVSKGFRVEHTGPGRFKLSGSFVERAAAMADTSLYESLERLQKVFRRIGVDKALRSAGVQPGDMVQVGPLELEWNEPEKRR